MQTVSTLFETELQKRIAERIETLKTNLAEGQSVKDFADYRRLVGEYHGLKLVATTLCQEVAGDINKR